MATTPMYHAGSRALQDAFDTRRLADRLEERLTREAFNDDDRAFIQAQPFFFLASADAEGWPDCSYKGGVPGFVQVSDAHTLVFPSYDGNGMFRSLGNLSVNPRVGLLFIDFEQPRRLRVQGRAELLDDAARLAAWPGAQLLVQVRVERIFPNCPRYIHPMRRLDLSPHAPRDGHVPPEPAWKRFDMFADVLPRCAVPGRGEPGAGESSGGA
jgi:predicted pyridoxine 5'-phosphate oxidase superfamily flavin-nucleotide-binding protein